MAEIQVTDEKGNVHIFPDGSTPEMISKALNVQAPSQSGWSVSSVLSGTSPLHQAIDKASQTEPLNTSSVGGFAKSVVNNLGAGTTRVFSPLAHPIDALGGLAKTAAAGLGDTQSQYDVAHSMVEPFVRNPGGESVAALPQAALALLGGGEAKPAVNAIERSGAGGGAEAAVSNGVQRAKSYFRPPTSPAVVSQTEMASRQLSAAVLPAGKDASNFIQAAQQEVPNVIDYAKRTNNPLNTQLEFSKAAQGYAQEVRDVYEKNVLGPVENKMVKTTGTGYGRQTGEGPDTYASLGDIDKRVTEINKQLDAPAMNADDSRRALASKTELQSEVAKLRDILHRNLSQSSGIAPEQIADLRQRVGRSYELANDTNAAVTGRMQAVGKSELGPVQITQLPSRAIEFARGGPVPIADRAFQRAIRSFPGQSAPLPSVQAPITGMEPPVRPSMSSALGIQAEPNPLQAVPMDPTAQVAALNDSLAARRVAGQGRAAQLRAEALARFERQKELLARARQIQENARNQ